MGLKRMATSEQAQCRCYLRKDYRLRQDFGFHGLRTGEAFGIALLNSPILRLSLSFCSLCSFTHRHAVLLHPRWKRICIGPYGPSQLATRPVRPVRPRFDTTRASRSGTRALAYGLSICLRSELQVLHAFDNMNLAVISSDATAGGDSRVAVSTSHRVDCH